MTIRKINLGKANR